MGRNWKVKYHGKVLPFQWDIAADELEIIQLEKKNPPDVSLGFFPGNLLLNCQCWGPLPVICVCSPVCAADAPQLCTCRVGWSHEPAPQGCPHPGYPIAQLGTLLRLPQKGYPGLAMGMDSWGVVMLNDFSHT